MKTDNNLASYCIFSASLHRGQWTLDILQQSEQKEVSHCINFYTRIRDVTGVKSWTNNQQWQFKQLAINLFKFNNSQIVAVLYACHLLNPELIGVVYMYSCRFTCSIIKGLISPTGKNANLPFVTSLDDLSKRISYTQRLAYTTYHINTLHLVKMIPKMG